MGPGVRIGWGSAYAEDNLDLAKDLADHGQLDFLCFDALAERTLALAQVRRQQDPQAGYDLRLDEFGAVFLSRAERGLRLLTNMGAANPVMAARRLRQQAQDLGVKQVQIAAVSGDDVLALIQQLNPILEETGRRVLEQEGALVSANAYIGAEPLVNALKMGAGLVIGGRIADPSLALAALMATFGWEPDDWPRLGRGIVVGHLLECGTHVTGGNFADPPYRVVPGLDNLGMPIAEVDDDGNASLSKLSGTGGLLSRETVKAQLVYEIHDPARYLTPDVTADFRQVRVQSFEEDRIQVSGGTGSERPPLLKVLVGIDEGMQVEAEVSYAGPGALDRASLSREVLERRLAKLPHLDPTRVRYDFIGLNAIHGSASAPLEQEPYEVRLRVAARVLDSNMANRVAHEVEWQYFGPSGAGGMRARITSALALYSTFVDRTLVPTTITVL